MKTVEVSWADTPFMLLHGDRYYPSQWPGDHAGQFATQEEAEHAAKMMCAGHGDDKWWRVIDLRVLQTVSRNS